MGRETSRESPRLRHDDARSAPRDSFEQRRWHASRLAGTGFGDEHDRSLLAEAFDDGWQTPVDGQVESHRSRIAPWRVVGQVGECCVIEDTTTSDKSHIVVDGFGIGTCNAMKLLNMKSWPDGCNVLVSHMEVHMHTIHRAAFSVVGCLLFILVAHCSSGAVTETTSMGLTASGPETPIAALSGSAVAQNVASDQLRPAPASAEVAAAPRQPLEAQTPRVRGRARSAATVATTSVVGVRRLIVAESVENREPVDSAESFNSDHERLFAFVEATNSGGDATELIVTFEDEEGNEVGDIALDVPANVSRWRTWAWTRHAREPGVWHVIVRTPAGEEISRQRFEIEEG